MKDEPLFIKDLKKNINNIDRQAMKNPETSIQIQKLPIQSTSIDHKLIRSSHLQTKQSQAISQIAIQKQTIKQYLNQQLIKKETDMIDYVQKSITSFLRIYNNSLNGIYNPDYNEDPIITDIRHELSLLYQDQYESLATKNLTDKRLQKQLTQFPGDYSNIAAFLSILNPLFRKLFAPAYEISNKIHQIMQKQATNIINTIMIEQQFSLIKTKLLQLVKKILEQYRRQLQLSLQSFIEAEIQYLYTNDQTYLKKKFKSMVSNIFIQDQYQLRIKPSRIIFLYFASQFRKRIDSYYNIVVRNLKEYIPKHIYSFLVVKCIKKLQFETLIFVNNFNKQKKNNQINFTK